MGIECIDGLLTIKGLKVILQSREIQAEIRVDSLKFERSQLASYNVVLRVQITRMGKRITLF